jgi:hypothetical protein
MSASARAVSSLAARPLQRLAEQVVALHQFDEFNSVSVAHCLVGVRYGPILLQKSDLKWC